MNEFWFGGIPKELYILTFVMLGVLCLSLAIVNFIRYIKNKQGEGK